MFRKALRSCQIRKQSGGFSFFDDHNAPPVQLILDFIADAEQFLNQHEDNVIAVHCKAGKGRTGVMVSCLLLHLGVVGTADEAMQYFGEQRTSDGHAVMIPSQKRYIRYYERVKKNGLPAPRPLILSHIKMVTVPSFDVGGGCDPYLIVMVGKESFKTSPPSSHLKREEEVDIDCHVRVDQHAKIILMDYDFHSSDDYMCHFWVTPEFVDDSLTLILGKDELDGAVKDTRNVHFKPEFQLQLFFKLP